MKFAIIALLGAAQTIRIRDDTVTERMEKEKKSRDEWTGQSIMNHCDADEDGFLQKTEAVDCIHRYFDKQAKQESDLLREHWDFIAGDDGKATVEELDAAMAAHEEHKAN